MYKRKKRVMTFTVHVEETVDIVDDTPGFTMTQRAKEIDEYLTACVRQLPEPRCTYIPLTGGRVYAYVQQHEGKIQQQ